MDLEYTWHKFLNDLKKQTLNIVFVFLVSGVEKKLSPKGLKIKTTELHFVSVILTWVTSSISTVTTFNGQNFLI